MFVIGVPSLPGIELTAADLVTDALHTAEVRSALGLRLAA